MKKQNIIFVLVLLLMLIFQMSFFYLPVYLDDIGISGYEIGVLFAIFSITGLLVIFPMGVLNDRVLSRTLILISFLLLGISYFGFALTKATLLLAIVFLVLGIGKNLSDTSFNIITYKTIKEKKAVAFGRLRFSVTFGAALGFVIGAILLVKYDFDKVFFFSGYVCIILAFFSQWLPDTVTKTVSLSEYKSNFFRKDVMLFSAVMFLFALHFGAEQTSYSLFLKNNLNLSWMSMGIYMSIPILIMSFISLKVGRLLNMNPDFNILLLIGLFFTGVGHILMTYPIVWSSFVFRIIHEIGDAIMFVILLFGISMLFGAEEIGGLSGLFSLVMIFAAFLASLIFGPVGETYGYHIPLIVSGITSLIAIPLVYKFQKTLSKISS